MISGRTYDGLVLPSKERESLTVNVGFSMAETEVADSTSEEAVPAMSSRSSARTWPQKAAVESSAEATAEFRRIFAVQSLTRSFEDV